MKPKAVVPRERAERDVDEAIIDVWRVLHGLRDIPSWMQDPDLI